MHCHTCKNSLFFAIKHCKRRKTDTPNGDSEEQEEEEEKEDDDDKLEKNMRNRTCNFLETYK